MIGLRIGSVLEAGAGLLRVRFPAAAIGDLVFAHAGTQRIAGTVQSISPDGALVAAHGSIDGVLAGDQVTAVPGGFGLPLGMQSLGRAFDARGEPIDDRGPLRRHPYVAAAPIVPEERKLATQPFWTGVRAIDGLLTLGRGARIGIFGAPGAGKSTLVNMLAEGAQADAIVLGLVGERGREAAEWLRRANARTTVVCATSDRPASERVAAARAAMMQAAVLRSRGLHVLLVLDSLARLGAAHRELAIACREPVGRGGYPASVFGELAKLLEVAGEDACGSVTMVATVLSDGDDRDPLSDGSRSLLDGHIMLSASLAEAGHFPAIDVLASTSRTMNAVVELSQAQDAAVVRAALAKLAETVDARSLGLPVADPLAVRAHVAEGRLEEFLRQPEGRADPARTLEQLHSLAQIV